MQDHDGFIGPVQPGNGPRSDSRGDFPTGPDVGEALPDESRFRYPGPKPKSAEAAILALADGAESSVRAMSDPTPTRIRTQVHAILTARLEDGQLDECSLTLADVHTIGESLIKSLCGAYHGRIAYPSEKKGEPKSAPADTQE